MCDVRPARGPDGGSDVSAADVIVGAVAAAVLIYLLWALINPEKL